MPFNVFKQAQIAHMQAMFKDKTHLFLADVDKDLLWDTYLDSFPPGTNELFRERREFDCSCCRAFIRQFGNVVSITGTQVTSIWDFQAQGRYVPVVRALSALVKAAPIMDVFVTKGSGFGTDSNIELKDGQTHTWQHFRADLPKALVYTGSKSEATIMGEYRDTKNVFKRSLDEIAPEALETVLDLVAEKTLYRGEEWLPALTQFQELQGEYHGLDTRDRDIWCWSKSVTLGGSVARIRNHSIGTLLQDLTEGLDVDQALRKWEAVMAPSNYKRPKAVFTKKMVEQAEKDVADLGYLDSLPRRHARIGDIKVNNVIWANKDAARVMDSSTGIFDLLKQEVTVKPKQFDQVPGIPVDKFIQDILTRAKSIEVLVENKHQANLVSLVAPVNPESPSMFKWSNGFSWAYSGNVADSSLKERVKAAGGSVTGVLRFSIQWNHEEYNPNDFDAHCIEPNGNHIFFPNKRHVHPSTGILDVDIINPRQGVPAVENITWSRLDKMMEGEYHFFVHNYSHRGGLSGFEAEVEYGGEIYQYVYDRELARNQNVTVARIVYWHGHGIKFLESLPSTTSTRQVWSMTTNQFYPVSSVMYSPNYWDGQVGIGNRHYLFMIPAARNDETPNGFFNEYLDQGLMEHKRVFEALGSRMKVAQTEEQLSGLGFSSTKRNSLVVRYDGQVARIIF